MLLLTVMLTLDPPAAHDHGALFRHITCQLAQHFSIDAADIGCPLGSFRRTVGFTQQIGLELVEAYGVGFQEVRVMQLFGQ
ncbi:hypothetical protein D3C72_2340510 [compost metagenome]